MNFERMLEETIARTNARMKRNEVAKSLRDVITDEPEVAKGIGLKLREKVKGKTEKFKDLEPGTTAISFMEKGERVDIVAPTWFADSWVNSSPLVSHNLAEWSRTISGSKLLKASVTGSLNPFFITRNLPRDTAMVILRLAVRSGYGQYLQRFPLCGRRKAERNL